MNPLHIAIIGAGTAGIATAILLAQQNIKVSLFEKVEQLSPVGAGLLLQPSGLAVFEHLDVLEHALSLTRIVTGLEGQLVNGKLLVNSHYQQAQDGFYGLGIHRASLTHVLESKAHEFSEQISWYLGHEIFKINEYSNHVTLEGQFKQQHFSAHFDLVIIANGARSHLRPESWVKINKPYPWGAKWIIVPECEKFETHILHQFYDRSQTMMGIMPTGKVPHSDQALSSIFWSMPSHQLDQFLTKQYSFETWLFDLNQRWPKVAEWIESIKPQVEHPEQWLSAHYRDVVMSKFGSGRIGVIGDAAHAMSPQLGQGANMALLDAWALGQSIQAATQHGALNLSHLWQDYHQHRLSSTNFYQFFSRLLTPLYQSHASWTGPLRDLSFSMMYQFPYFRKEMAITISGLKSGLFSNMKYQDIAQSSFKK